MTRALLVVDMIEDFVHEGIALYCGPSMAEIVPVIQQELARAHRAAEPGVYLTDEHLLDDAEFQLFPPHAIAGTKGAQIVPELASAKGDLAFRNAVTPDSSPPISTSRSARPVCSRLDGCSIRLPGEGKSDISVGFQADAFSWTSATSSDWEAETFLPLCFPVSRSGSHGLISQGFALTADADAP